MDTALEGGIPKGRLIEIYGGEGSCKTTFAVHCLAQVQQAGGRVALIEPENSLDPDYAARLGVNLTRSFMDFLKTALLRLKCLVIY
jgi:recombination protein RecA